ncbi:MAG TPA: hypothetical protein V6D17_25060 [Candidatus Obscuribacterales bacterium]
MSTAFDHLKPPHRPSLAFGLKLPKEHGAVVIFSLASSLSASLAVKGPVFALGLLVLWLAFLSLHRPLQCALIAVGGAFIMWLSSGNPMASVTPLFMAGGLKIVEAAAARLNAPGRETFGILGVSILPFMLAATAGSPLSDALLVGACFAACALTGNAIVRSARQELKAGVGLPLAISALLWFGIALVEPVLLVLCCLPFSLEMFWLQGHEKPSFKSLGIAATVCMVLVTISLALWRSM